MAEMPGESDSHIAEIIYGLQSADTVSEKVWAEAHMLERHAQRLKREAPVVLDDAIDGATASLLELADSGTATDRELLLGVTEINQYKPSRVIWSGPADKAGILGNFDSIAEGAPVILGYRTPVVSGVVGKALPRVSVAIAQGMGGLPEANIKFSLRRMESTADRGDYLDRSRPITLSHDALGRAAIGTEAVQGYIDSLRLQTEALEPRSAGVTNENHLEQVARAAHLLTQVAGANLDTASIDARVSDAKAYNETAAAQRARMRRYVRRRPRLLR